MDFQTFPTSGQFITAGRFVGSWDVPFHTHPEYEIILATQGVCQIQFAGDSDSVDLHCQPGQLLLIPPTLAHNQINVGEVITFYVRFQSQADIATAQIAQVAPDAWLEHWLDDLVCLAEQFETELGSVLLLAILHRMRQLLLHTPQQLKIPWQVTKAQAFIRNNYVRDISLHSIAEHCCISISYLKVLFRQSLGISPLTVVKQLRLRKAEQLLLDQYWHIKQISDACGFRDQQYFSRVFKMRHGKTPSEYRRHIVLGKGHKE